MNSNPSFKDSLLPGKEYPQPGEEDVAKRILKLLQDEMLRLYAKKGEMQLRQIHPKMNGCVKAEFRVLDGLRDDLKVGLFKNGGSYPAWIRFSNGKTKPLPDWKKDIRGFAIKIMNVPGEKLDGIGNHDFILMNTKNFVSGDVSQFERILKVVTTPTGLSNIIPKLITAFSNLPLLSKAKKAAIMMTNPAEIPYFSTVPYRFGNESRAVKYAVFPSSTNSLVTDDKKTEHQIRENFVATLKKNEISYDFFVQFQEDPEKMPIEDPTIEWTSKFEKVATIRIPRQVFDTPAINELGENMALSPWHCLPAHRPIGNFNRVRKIIYEGMYTFRHEHNGVMDIEPAADSNFYNDTNIT